MSVGDEQTSIGEQIFARLVEMGANLSWNPRDGRWYAQLSGPAGGAMQAIGEYPAQWDPDPTTAIGRLYQQWCKAGRPQQRLYTIDEIAAIDKELRKNRNCDDEEK